ncbi:hypothetical protein ElyMa_002595800 [Elysia marginata]|uniref:AP2/ERF domain-containing protein n=1 Tax=Elysia marginata TaxID=1093978 RepID=A0AAV4H3F0_9GAST|nr:hypothetical protein ElyMa_002595800 [Elysia marginata]
MDRRVRAKRAAAQKRKKNAKAARRLWSMENAWGCVRFVAGRGYTAEALFDTKEKAEEAARAETQKAMDAGAAYTVVFAVPIHNSWDPIPGQSKKYRSKYTRGVAYYATLRAARGGDSSFRTLALWPSQEEAEEAAAATAKLENKDVYTYVGGPVKLAPLKRDDAPVAAPKQRTQTTTRHLEAKHDE